MKDALSGVLAALPALNKAELLAVKAAAEGLLGPLRGANGAPATPLFEALTRALGARLSLDQFQATGTYKSFSRGERAFMAFVDENFPSVKSNKVPYRAFIAFLVDLVIDDMKQRKIPISIGTVSVNLESVPDMFERAYPDYIKSGFGHLVLEAMTKWRS